MSALDVPGSHENVPERGWDHETDLVEALIRAWDEGYGAGWNDCLLDMQKRGVLSRNPYGAGK